MLAFIIPLSRPVYQHGDETSHYPENNDSDKILLKHFGLFGPPAIIFFNQQSEEIKSHRLIGFSKPENFIKHIKQVKSL